MNAAAVNLLRFLQIPKQCIIPIYQRTYSWTDQQCEFLWNDILRVGTNNNIPTHFVGSFVHIQDNPALVLAGLPQCMVIDGQQRMTTISLLLLAIANEIKARGDEFQVNESTVINSNYIINSYLINQNEQGNDRFKLILTQSDKETYLSLLQSYPTPKDYSLRIVENYEYFQDKLKEVELSEIFKGIQKLMVVEIALDRTVDNPQLIFESLNSTGLELSQADLIRNFILMGMQPDLQKRIYDQYWYPMEVLFGHAEYSSYFDRFMRDYLTTKINRIPNISNVHKEFKYYSSSSENGEIESIVADIYKYAKYFVKMVLGKETNQSLKAAFESINQLKVDVIYPFLLQVYNDYQSEVIKEDDFLEILNLLESYIFRRAICGIPTNSMNKTFATLHKEIDKENYLESLKAVFILKDSYRKFPTNEEFLRNLTSKDVYNFRNRNYLLSKLENSQLEKEPVNLDKYSIEHILPQNPNLSDNWKNDLGNNWKEIQSKYLHTLGNLTLTGYNSELSDRPFLEKRDIQGGFRNSGLYLNSFIRDLLVWSEEQIIQRANLLSDIAKNVWIYPKVEDSVLQKYVDAFSSKPVVVSEYDLTQYRHMNEWRLDKYADLKERILNLAPGITEQFNKHYIVFRTPSESNFVCIVPQKGRLRVTLPIKFEDINDPLNLCSDIANLGYWGGGQCVLFGIKEKDELVYPLKLVNQSYEHVLID
jgi:uncharacterized protein with ParB-like and HNH nuclease domain/predicted transport protein